MNNHFSRQSEEKRDFVLKIAIVDDLELDAEQLSHLILSYMKEHRIPAAAPEIFPNGETFLASFTASLHTAESGTLSIYII